MKSMNLCAALMSIFVLASCRQNYDLVSFDRDGHPMEGIPVVPPRGDIPEISPENPLENSGDESGDASEDAKEEPKVTKKSPILEDEGYVEEGENYYRFPDRVEEAEGPQKGRLFCRARNVENEIESRTNQRREILARDSRRSDSSPGNGPADIDGKKVLICHVPPGNPSAAHEILISENGWLNGHGKQHSGDHLGVCGELSGEELVGEYDGIESSNDEDKKHNLEDAPRYVECPENVQVVE